jgi:septal ring factor EnvC (AmiA/AmiB activator)
MNFTRLILILIVTLLCGFVVSAQDQICISQEAANKCAELARTDKAKDEKIAALEAKIKAHETTIAELKEANARNVADLKDRLHTTELALAEKTGRIIACEANDVSNRAIITAMIPMLRQKVVGIKIF